MWLAFKSFISGNMAKLLELLAALGAGAAVAIGIYQQGKRSEKVDELTRVNKAQERAHDIEDKNRAELRPGDAAQRLRDEWS